jgi:TolB-like protein
VPDIFLSYTRDDQPTAQRFAEAFEREGFSVWWDQTLNPGEAYDKVTEKALEQAGAVVVLWSKKSVDSRWVRAEATQAGSNGTLVPVMIEPCKRPIMFELTHTADLSHWKGDSQDKAWQSYVAGLRRSLQIGVPKAPLPAANPVRPRRRFGRGGAVTAIAALALAVVAVGWWVLNRNIEKPAAQAVTASASAVATEVTLAVLPFVNLSSDPEQEYFSDGLTEEILNQLAQIGALRVTGRTSSFSFKGKNEDLRGIADKLDVSNLLEGSVRRDGNNVRITAQLINGEDGAHLWSRNYDRELSNIFALQEDIAKDVAQALSIKLDVGDLNRSQGGTTNVEAHDRYLRGRKFQSQDERKASAQAVAQFREAVALDPTFSRAWLELGEALETRRLFEPGEAAAVQRDLALARERVKALSPDAWWTRQLVAREMREAMKWSEADTTIHAALASVEGRQVPLELALGYLEIMFSIGRVQEGLVLGERAMAEDPLALNLARIVQAMLDCAGRPEDAQAEYQRTKAQGRARGALDYWAMARLLMRDDAEPAAIRAQFRILAENGSSPTSLVEWLSENYTDRAAALPAVREAFEDPSNQALVPSWAIGMYADRFGDKDLALAALRRGVSGPEKSVNIFWFPQKTGLRTDPRFKEMVREVGLVDYWRISGNWGDYCKPLGADDFECR